MARVAAERAANMRISYGSSGPVAAFWVAAASPGRGDSVDPSGADLGWGREAARAMAALPCHHAACPGPRDCARYPLQSRAPPRLDPHCRWLGASA